MASIIKYIEKSYEKAILKEYKRIAKKKKANKNKEESKCLNSETSEAVTKSNIENILSTCNIVWNKLSTISDEEERKTIIDGMYTIARDKEVSKALITSGYNVSYDNLIKSWLKLIDMSPIKKDFRDKTAFEFEMSKDLSRASDKFEMSDILKILSKNEIDEKNGVNIPRMIYMDKPIEVNTKLIQEENKVMLKIYIRSIKE